MTGVSLWLDGALAGTEPLAGEHRTRVAIVGGGLAGTSIALHLARAGVDCTLVERGILGAGATGHSTGMLSPGAGPPVRAWRGRGDDLARRVFQASLDAVAYVKRLIATEEMDCDLEETGQLVAARGPRAERRLREEALALEALGFDAPFAAGGEVSPLHRATLRYPKAAILDPVKLCRELARVARASGARVHENTSVVSVTPGEVRLARGTLRADRVVVATNAFAQELGLQRRRVVPIFGHVIATEPVAPSPLWEGHEGVIDTRNFFDYLRPTADDRVVVGGGRVGFASDPGTWARLERELARTFPALASARIERRWAAAMGFTLDRMPVVGELTDRPGVLFAGGWCGHGIALSVASGALVRDLVLGRGVAPLPWVRGTAPALPPDPLARAGIAVYLAGLAVADWWDEAAGTRARSRSRSRSLTKERVS